MARKPRVPDSENFKLFWQSYPRRIGKGVARLAFINACKIEDASVIIEAAQKFQIVSENTEIRFIPHPSTWLRAERWDDDLSHFDTNNESRLDDILNAKWDDNVFSLEDKRNEST
jgi:hypothetical protein